MNTAFINSLVLCLFTLVNDLSTGIESKKGEEDGKYIPINVRMQRTQVDSLISAFMPPQSSAVVTSRINLNCTFDSEFPQMYRLIKPL